MPFHAASARTAPSRSGTELCSGGSDKLHVLAGVCDKRITNNATVAAIYTRAASAGDDA